MPQAGRQAGRPADVAAVGTWRGTHRVLTGLGGLRYLALDAMVRLATVAELLDQVRAHSHLGLCIVDHRHRLVIADPT